MSDTGLGLSGVKRHFQQGAKRLDVLQGVDLAVSPGEVVALVAPSGAGKSTLLQIAGLLDTASEGTVAIGGQDLSSLADDARTAARRSMIGFIYQFHHLLPEFTAEENVSIPQLAEGVTRTASVERSRELLERAGLGERLNHRPAELSGGEQQRVAFCRALANRPKILLADEPTGNLDPETSDRIFGILLELVRDTGLAALIATHNHELAIRMDRVVTLSEGQIQIV